MNDELSDLLEAAMYKEVASMALYTEGQNKTDDAGATALLKELAAMESGHLEMLKNLRARNTPPAHWHRRKAVKLRLSDYLSGGDQLEGIGLQETLLFAMKQEQRAVEFYSRLSAVFKDEAASMLCQQLVDEENDHKRKLELFYDDLVFAED